VKQLGLILIVAGMIALGYGGYRYSKQVDVRDSRPRTAPATEQNAMPIAPMAGWVALVCGVALLTAPPRRPHWSRP
jgi:uncharacterized membrane protein YidH (DUF202 family)